MPEFQGKQQKLSNFFTKLTKRVQVETTGENVADKKEEEIKAVVNVNNIGIIKAPDTENIVKRTLEKGNSSSQPLKRQKTAELKKSGSGAKQGSLISFFKGKSNIQPTKNCSESGNGSTVKSVGIGTLNNVSLKVQESGNTKDTGHTSKYFNSDGKQFVNSDKSGTDSANDTSKPNVGSVVKENTEKTTSAWKNLLGGLGPVPLCKGHNEPCVLRMVKKPGPNKGRQFYTCARGEGLKSNPEARCDFFKWIDVKKKS